MFVFSLKASKIKFFIIAFVCVAAAVAVISFMPDTEHTVSVNGVQSQYDGKIKFDGIKDEKDRLSLINNLGYKVKETPRESVKVKIPSKFDAVLEKYNDLQKNQGFNLAKYKNKKVDRYTYTVTELPSEQSLPKDEVLLTIIVHKDKVIGADVFFSGLDGMVLPLLK